MKNINTIAELLNEFVKAERDILNEQKIKHPVTIGEMYEGLTGEIVEKSIFLGLDLRVVKNSFIIGCDTEFDVLLVEGEGKVIPHTDRYQYSPEKVIAVIQVKKNLYGKDLKEGYSNLQFLIDSYEHTQPELYMGRLFRDAFRATCRKDISAKKLGELEEYEEYIYHTLKMEAFLPVRIIWGYNGFASEFTFRESFIDYLGKNQSADLKNKIPGFGPHNFPSLIICGQYSMIKHNGMPIAHPILKDNWWSLYSTSSYNPVKFLLETIWTRLSYKYELSSDIFGEDLEVEPVKRFLDCRIKKQDEHIGWEYSYFIINSKELQEPAPDGNWSPAELDAIQFDIISQLCIMEISLSAEHLEEYVTEGGSYSSLDDFLDKLKETGLVGVENHKLKLLTDLCQPVVLPNGKFYAGENKSRRVTNWFNREMAELRKQNSTD